MHPLKNINIIFGVGVLLSLFAFLFHVIGMSTTRWSYRTSPDFDYGLFRYCVGDSCSYYKNLSSDQEAAQAMTIIGVLCSVIALTAACAHVTLILFRRYFEGVAIAAGVAAILAFTTIIIGVIVWAATYHQDLTDVSSDYSIGWSLTLSALGAGFDAVAGVLFLVARD